jgi:hypothetical protein
MSRNHKNRKEEGEMNKKMMLALSMAFVMIFGVYGMAFAKGGGPDPGACKELPLPDAGFFVRGEFTVSQCPLGMCYPEQSVVHIFLKKGNQTELFNFSASSLDICSSTAATILEDFKSIPCIYGVAEEFGFPQSVGVITNIEILQTDNCGAFNEMMRGEIVIRLVPVPPPPPPAVK